MQLTLRLSLSLAIGISCVPVGFAFYQTRSETADLRVRLQRQALVLGETLAQSAAPLVNNRPAVASRELEKLVSPFRDREQIAGVAILDAQGQLLAATSGLNAKLGVRPGSLLPEQPEPASAEFVRAGGRLMHVASIPLRSASGLVGRLAVFHDAGHIEQEAAALWRRALASVLIQTLLIMGITLLTVRRELRRPLQRMASWMHEIRLGGSSEAPTEGPAELEPLTREVTRLATSFTAARASADEEARLRERGESQWTTERLRVFVESRLGGDRLFVVSNREPYEHSFNSGGGIQCAVPASGLVTALEPILRACDGTWIAQGTGNADRETVDEEDRVRVPPENPQYTLRRVWLTPEEDKGFYLGFANEGLWPLCHIAHTRPIFRIEDWEHYRAVNEKFAAVLLAELEGHENPAVLLQDYHFALLPKMIKAARPDARVAIFWHIPWPNAEAFGICPWQRELLDGLLGADLIGFHIRAHCSNFLETVDRTLECRIDREQSAVARNGHSTLIRPFPISVGFDTPDRARPAAELPHLERVNLLAKLGVRAPFMGVGVDRIDYTKGIPERFRAIERFFEKYPLYRREFTFVQIGSPSRTSIQRYHDLMKEVNEEAERINRRFQASGWQPIVLLTRQHSHAEIQPYYQAADLCLVTSLHDGMNLVAKEFVASREDARGVLILSQFAGAAHELSDALIINPYDTEQMSDAILQALEMPAEERRARMHRMRMMVRERNVYRWAGSLVGELCSIRTPARAASLHVLPRTAMARLSAS